MTVNLNPKINTRFSSYIKPGLVDNLPIDLKREILEIAAYLYPPFALRMAVVSREIQPWAERIIYRELFFSGQRLYHRGDSSDKPTPLQKFQVALDARPPEFFAEYVRALHFDGTYNAEEILPIIQACSGVTNFGMYAAIEGLGAIEVARLVHSLPLHTLFVSEKNLTTLLSLDVAPTKPQIESVPEATETDAPDVDTQDTENPSVDPAVIKDAAEDAAEAATEAPPAPLPSTCLHKLQRLGLVDHYDYPARRFPALTHLAIIPDLEDKVIRHVRAALADRRIESLVMMLNYVNAPRQTKTLRLLRDITDPRLVLFTLPVSPTRFIEDDLWDLANEFPDEEQPISEIFVEPCVRSCCS
ncbi:hypothetical protein DXG01_008846 [Tephrocybe rancida]|nr:hypothetical protein DXG01_008846 [Tephrocybe rancida]